MGRLWGKVDDKLWGSPKWLATTKGGKALWVTALSWSMDQLTDGVIPRAIIRLLGGSSADIRSLCDAGLWIEHEEGFAFHDWLDYQPSRNDVLANRNSAAARQKLARSPKLKDEVRKRDGDRCRYCGMEVTWGHKNGSRDGTFDHVVPNGPTSLENLVVACRSCNSAKGRRTPEQAGMLLIALG